MRHAIPKGTMLNRTLILFTCTIGLFSLIPEMSVIRAADQIDFDQHEIILGSAERQTVLTASLFGGTMQDILVVHKDETGVGRLKIYVFSDSEWAPKLDTTLPPDVVFVDVANIGGRDRLLTYSKNRLSWFDPESTKEHELVSVTSSFEPPRKNEISHVDITQDINDDGRDDLVLPDVDGFWVIVQKSNGTFTAPLKIGTAVDLSGITGADGYRYDPWSQSRIHSVDYNLDGRSDLVFWDNDFFNVHLQDERRLFVPEAKTFTTDVPFDSDYFYSLAFGEMTGRVLYTLADMNSDGLADLVVYSLQGKRISQKKSTFEVHFGAPTADGNLTFARDAGIIFQSDDKIQLSMQQQDFDGDGQLDVMITTIDVRFLGASLWKRLKGFMGDDVLLELEFYRNEGGSYAEQPNFVRRIALDGAPSHTEPGSVPLDIALRGATHKARKTQEKWPRAFNPNLLIGDVTGDGRADLLIEVTFRGLDVHLGVPGLEIFDSQSQILKLIVPHDREYSRLVDLNNDGVHDILLHHPFSLRDIHGGRTQPPGSEPHRIKVLIAR
jgi:hypothetical protein